MVGTSRQGHSYSYYKVEENINCIKFEVEDIFFKAQMVPFRMRTS